MTEGSAFSENRLVLLKSGWQSQAVIFHSQLASVSEVPHRGFSLAAVSTAYQGGTLKTAPTYLTR